MHPLSGGGGVRAVVQETDHRYTAAAAAIASTRFAADPRCRRFHQTPVRKKSFAKSRSGLCVGIPYLRFRTLGGLHRLLARHGLTPVSTPTSSSSSTSRWGSGWLWGDEAGIQYSTPSRLYRSNRNNIMCHAAAKLAHRSHPIVVADPGSYWINYIES